MTTEAPDRILRIKALLERIGLSRATLHREIERGSFPRQIRISERCAGWYESAVLKWMQNPIAATVPDHDAKSGTSHV